MARVKRLLALTIVSALAAACQKATPAVDTETKKKVDDLGTKVDTIDKRLKKLEDFIAEVTKQPPQADPAVTYSVPVAGDPYVGPAHAKVTLIEVFEFG
jgi:protein-disulfide isomerase